MAVGIGDHRRGAVVQDVVADAALPVRIGPVDQSVSVVVQIIAGERHHIDQVAGIEGIGGDDIVGRRTAHAGTGRLVGERDLVDIAVVGIPVVGQIDKVGTRRPCTVQGFVTHLLVDQDIRLGDGHIDPAYRLVGVTDSVLVEGVFLGQPGVFVLEGRVEGRVEHIEAVRRMDVRCSTGIYRFVEQPRCRLHDKPLVGHFDALGIGNVEAPVEPALIQRRQPARVQAHSGDKRCGLGKRIGARYVALSIRSLIHHVDVLYRDIGEAGGLESEPATGLDADGALLADLHLLESVPVITRRIIFATGADLALLQVEADDTRPGGIHGVVVGAIGFPVRTGDRRGEPERGAVTQGDLPHHIGTQAEIIDGNPRRVAALSDIEVVGNRLSRGNRRRRGTLVDRRRRRNCCRVDPHLPRVRLDGGSADGDRATACRGVDHLHGGTEADEGMVVGRIVPAVIGQQDRQGQELVRVVGENENRAADGDVQVFRIGRNACACRIAGAIAGEGQGLMPLGGAEGVVIDRQGIAQRCLIGRIRSGYRKLLRIDIQVGVPVVVVRLDQHHAEGDDGHIAVAQHVDLIRIDRM